MKTYSQHLLFFPTSKLLVELQKDPAEIQNFLGQRKAAIAADKEGKRFQV